MSKKIFKAGIIGSGFAAKFHFEALKRVFSTRVEVVGAYSPNEDNLLAFCHEKKCHPLKAWKI